MCVEVTRGYLRITGLDSFEKRVVYKDVLVLGLHHVVALRAKACHVTIDIYSLLVFDALEHRFDDHERTRTTDASAVIIMIIISLPPVSKYNDKSKY